MSRQKFDLGKEFLETPLFRSIGWEESTMSKPSRRPNREAIKQTRKDKRRIEK